MAQPALADDLTRHAVYLERLKAGEVRRFAPFLQGIDRRLREVLTRGGLTAFQRERTEAMLREVDGIMREVLARYTGEVTAGLRELAAYEAQFVAGALAEHGYRANVPAIAQLWAAASSEPLMAGKGQLLAGFIENWTVAERERVTGAIRLAVAEGQTVQQAVTAIRGTKARNYQDGILSITNRNAGAVVRTGIAHVTAAARHETFNANTDILAGYMWSATLDQRTSSVCRSLDGRIFQFGKGPMPPAHVNCRSSTTPVLKGEWAALTRGAKRASQDGPVDATETYYSWLQRQSASFQDEVLGPTRGKLLREGGLSARRFAELQLDRNWTPLTLEEMKRLEPLAFKRAGLE